MKYVELPPNIFKIKQWHLSLGLHAWNNNRTDLLCRMMDLSLRELCALAGVYDPKKINRLQDDQIWPVTIAILFNIYESCFRNLVLDQPWENPFPVDLLKKLSAENKEKHEREAKELKIKLAKIYEI